MPVPPQTLVHLANRILRAEQLDAKLHATCVESIARVAEFLLGTGDDRSQPSS